MIRNVEIFPLQKRKKKKNCSTRNPLSLSTLASKFPHPKINNSLSNIFTGSYRVTRGGDVSLVCKFVSPWRRKERSTLHLSNNDEKEVFANRMLSSITRIFLAQFFLTWRGEKLGGILRIFSTIFLVSGSESFSSDLSNVTKDRSLPSRFLSVFSSAELYNGIYAKLWNDN